MHGVALARAGCRGAGGDLGLTPDDAMMQQKDAKLKQQSREISALKRKRQVIEAKLGL